MVMGQDRVARRQGREREPKGALMLLMRRQDRATGSGTHKACGLEEAWSGRKDEGKQDKTKRARERKRPNPPRKPATHKEQADSRFLGDAQNARVRALRMYRMPKNTHSIAKADRMRMRNRHTTSSEQLSGTSPVCNAITLSTPKHHTRSKWGRIPLLLNLLCL